MCQNLCTLLFEVTFAFRKMCLREQEINSPYIFQIHNSGSGIQNRINYRCWSFSRVLVQLATLWTTLHCGLLAKGSNGFVLIAISKGGTEKSGLLCSNPYNSSTRRPTLTCYIPNQWKFNEDFTELYRFEIAALIEEDNLA